MAVLGGARGTNEDAYAWAQLADAIGITHRDAQLGDGLPAEILGLDRATIDDAANATTIVLLGPDLKEELPVLYLRLRDAAEKRRSRIIEFSTFDTGMTPSAWKSVRYEPGAQRDAVAKALADDEIAAQIASGDVVVVVGRANLAESAEATVAALQTLLDGVPTPRCSRRSVAATSSAHCSSASRRATPTTMRLRRSPRRPRAASSCSCCSVPIRSTTAPTPTSPVGRSPVPAGSCRSTRSPASPPSTPTSFSPHLRTARRPARRRTSKDRVTTLAQQVTATGTSRPDWMIAVELGLMIGDRSFGADHALRGVSTVGDVTALIAADVASFADVSPQALAGTPDGVLTRPVETSLDPVVFSAPGRNRYDYRLVVSRKLYDRAVGTQMSRSLVNLAPGSAVHVHPLDLDAIGVADGSDVKIISAKAGTVLPICSNARVPRGVVWSPFNQGAGTIEDIVDATTAITDVRIERI